MIVAFEENLQKDESLKTNLKNVSLMKQQLPLANMIPSY